MKLLNIYNWDFQRVLLQGYQLRGVRVLLLLCLMGYFEEQLLGKPSLGFFLVSCVPSGGKFFPVLPANFPGGSSPKQYSKKPWKKNMLLLT